MNLFRDGLKAISAAARLAGGDLVTYSRGTDISFEIDHATQGRSVWQQKDRGGIVTATTSVDWLVAAEDLDVTPERHDRITLQLDGAAVVYEVMPFGPENRLWRFHGADRSTVRIYTKVLSDSGAVL
jgi:hypothetical protein